MSRPARLTRRVGLVAALTAALTCTAVVGARSATPPAPPPTAPLDLTITARGAGRATVTVAGDAVGSVELGSSWRSYTVPAVARTSDPVGLLADHTGTAELRSWSWSPGSPGFTARGTRVLDPSGRPFTLRGVNRNSLESTPRGWYLNARDADAMRDWGVNAVRVQLGQQFWLTGSCRYDADYARRVDAVVRNVTERGMLAVLDLHWSTKGSPCLVLPGQQPMPDEMSLTFWRQVAARYRSNPLVAFDLYNEPFGVGAETWRNGGWMGLWRAVGMQQLYDAVRSTGARNLVFVSGVRFAYDVRPALVAPLTGFGIVYATHIYCFRCPNTLPHDVDGVVGAVAARVPVAVTEFGTRSSSPTYNATLIDWAERRGLGWLAYTWAAARPEDYGLFDDWTTYRPNVAGVPVHDALARHRSS